MLSKKEKIVSFSLIAAIFIAVGVSHLLIYGSQEDIEAETENVENVENLGKVEPEVKNLFAENPKINSFDFMMEDLDSGDSLEDLLEMPSSETKAVEPVQEWEVVEDRVPYVTYGIYGRTMDPGVYEYLVTELRAHGIEWWIPYAVAQAWQESRFDPMAKAAHNDGFDCGLYQYYDLFWESKVANLGLIYEPNCIFDAYVQVYVYVCEFSERFKSGASIEKALSDHYTGGQGYCQTYVDDVMQWIPILEKR